MPLFKKASLCGTGQGSGQPEPTFAILDGNVNAMTTATQKAQNTLQELVEGNQRFQQGELRKCKADMQRVQELKSGQSPPAVIVTCSDSRVGPEIIFDQGLGDIFVVRVAGNVLDTHALGSIIYAVEHLGSRLIAVIGHSKCGACKAAQGAWVAKAAAGPGKETPAGTDPVSQLVGVILGSCDTVAKANTGINTGSKTEEELMNVCPLEAISSENAKKSAAAILKGLVRYCSHKNGLVESLVVVAGKYFLDDASVQILQQLWYSNGAMMIK
ncbi:hypothetical protein WJX84_008230 [Apatococcus fuscideae]|uniref:Carbonic anhydrase n=1 Tax=Apatococcus fuscideae TaxID=2026836 RepID=A0AAW1SMB2_9CHLO